MTDLTTWVKFGPFMRYFDWPVPVFIKFSTSMGYSKYFINGPNFTHFVRSVIASLFDKNILLWNYFQQIMIVWSNIGKCFDYTRFCNSFLSLTFKKKLLFKNNSVFPTKLQQRQMLPVNGHLKNLLKVRVVWPANVECSSSVLYYLLATCREAKTREGTCL